MINLLPPDNKRQLRAARTNTLLLRYNFLLLGALVFILIALGVVYFYLNTSRAVAEQTIKDNDAKVANYASVKQQADNFRTSLSTAKQILDQNVAYTKVILKIAHLLPPGVVMDKLSLDSKTFGTPTTISANAKDYDAALALKDSLQSSSLFSNVYFASISGGGGGSYPIKVTLNVTIQKDAAK